MENIYIAGTGYWKGDEVVTNDEIVTSFNSYVERFNDQNILIMKFAKDTQKCVKISLI